MTEKSKVFLTDLVVGLVITVAVVAMNWAEDFHIVRRLCDGFFVAGVMLLGAGGMKYVRNQGAFDMAGYGIKSAVLTAMPFLKTQFGDTADEEFLEYRERKSEKRKSPRGELLAGLIYMALAIVMCAIFLAIDV